MRNRALFLPLDVDVIDDPVQKVRAWQLSKLWNTLHGNFLLFYPEHIKFDRDPGVEPYISFVKCYASMLAAFRKARRNGTSANRYSRNVRIGVYDGLFAIFKKFNVVYEYRFEDFPSAEFDIRLLELALDCGVAIERMRSIKDGEFYYGEAHLTRNDALARGGRARAAKTIDAKEFVLNEWRAHSEAYAGNKSEFARHYVRRLKNELEVEVKEKTIRETWLMKPPLASK